ncbi:hypothetical protein T4D_3350 [Trichinella pseudospiralis]|uniref:Uncharacterized protein n=1 Tax=Trichinella pseudospiralis TaxID=6337 RepID=A0A0V1FJI7_TRIPS|nr:hypothetical protein T4D_3350 [Trichinella pseudospiralis]
MLMLERCWAGGGTCCHRAPFSCLCSDDVGGKNSFTCLATGFPCAVASLSLFDN